MTILLLQGCSKTKKRVPSAVPALELYDGYYFKIIKKAMRDDAFDPSIDVCVLSAEYGIIEASELITWYERQMDDDRARELKMDVQEKLLELVDGSYQQVIVNVGRRYRPALGNIQEYLSTDVQFIEGEGIGVKGNVLKRLVRGETNAVNRHTVPEP